jgi:hypothetical protein
MLSQGLQDKYSRASISAPFTDVFDEKTTGLTGSAHSKLLSKIAGRDLKKEAQPTEESRV